MTIFSAKKVIIYIAVFVFFAFNAVNNTYSAISESSISYKTNKESKLLSPVNLEVDSNGNIYIATNEQVDIYDNTGLFLYAIRVPLRGNAMRMKMLEDDIISIVLNNKRDVYVVTPEGDLIEKKGDPDGSIYIDYENYQGKLRHVSGNTYRLTNIFGYTRVVKYTPDGDKSIVFTIPFQKWLIKVLFNLIYIVLLPFVVIYLLIKFVKNPWYLLLKLPV